MAGQSALDLMEKACNEPNTDENVPRCGSFFLSFLFFPMGGWEVEVGWNVGCESERGNKCGFGVALTSVLRVSLCMMIAHCPRLQGRCGLCFSWRWMVPKRPWRPLPKCGCRSSRSHRTSHLAVCPY